MIRCFEKILVILCVLFASSIYARDIDEETHISTGEFGGPLTNEDWTMQCSGWYPDWLVNSDIAPAIDSGSFQLSQDYSLGVQLDENVYIAPPPPSDRPWMQIEFDGPNANPSAYAQSLLDYAFQDMGEVNFDPNQAGDNGWYHAPLMHTGGSRREPLKGVTRERSLRVNEYSHHPWFDSGLRTVAIGFYDKLASYTLGKVYNHPDPGASNANAAEFINGAFVSKPIFSEYDPSVIDPDLDPLVGAPEWEVLDLDTGEPYTVRLTQFDIAVKDERATSTEWVFATYAYHKDLIPTQSNPWRRLVPVGLQWGSDGLLSPGGVDSIEQSWINPDLPAVWREHLGIGDRLNGPIDNPVSACMSCHSTAQVHPTVTITEGGSRDEFSGADILPYNSCSVEDSWRHWFRDLPERMTFGAIDEQTCEREGTSKNYVALDYSLQLYRGLESALFWANQNPCAQFVDAPELTILSTIDVDEARHQILNSRLWGMNFPTINRLVVDNDMDVRNVNEQTGISR